MPNPEELLAEELAKRETEWGTYVAVGPIYIGGGRAFNPGDPVPVSHVERGVVDREAVKEVTDAASAASTEQDNADA